MGSDSPGRLVTHRKPRYLFAYAAFVVILVAILAFYTGGSGGVFDEEAPQSLAIIGLATTPLLFIGMVGAGSYAIYGLLKQWESKGRELRLRVASLAILLFVNICATWWFLATYHTPTAIVNVQPGHGRLVGLLLLSILLMTPCLPLASRRSR